MGWKSEFGPVAQLGEHAGQFYATSFWCVARLFGTRFTSPISKFKSMAGNLFGSQPDQLYGPVAQLGARSVRIREVEGSNPFRSTTKQTCMCKSAFLCGNVDHRLFIDPLILALSGQSFEFIESHIEFNFQRIVPIHINRLDKL